MGGIPDVPVGGDRVEGSAVDGDKVLSVGEKSEVVGLSELPVGGALVDDPAAVGKVLGEADGLPVIPVDVGPADTEAVFVGGFEPEVEPVGGDAVGVVDCMMTSAALEGEP